MEAVESLYNDLANSSSDLVIFPTFGIMPILLMTWSTMTGIANYFGQQTNPMEYSKFAPSKSANQVSGKVLYLIAYTFPFCAGILIFFYYTTFVQPPVTSQSITYYHFIAPNILLILHFVKRLYESLFVHISTSKSNVVVAIQIGIFYAMGNMVMLYYQLLKGNASDYAECNQSFIIGVILFVLGQYGNYYHHYLLRMNRLNNAGDKKSNYVIPSGGFFAYTWCPHYFFEIIAWFGVAVVSKHLMLFLHTLTMTGYLIGRSKKTKEWYSKQFGAKCPDRKAIIPFLL